MDNARIATLAQLQIGALDETRAGMVQPNLYRDVPDFEDLVRIEQSYVPGTPPPSPAPGSWLAFVFSKPNIEANTLQVHAFEPSREAGPRADDLWVKLKRVEVLKQLVSEAVHVENPAALMNRAILAWASAQVPEPTRAIVCDADLPVADGPSWLRSAIDIVRSGDRVSVRSPITQTPVDAPPRFAGMHYMKVISPSWALRTLRGE